ncbi:hypothetical protein [Bacteriovorax sp. Seq25_V]|uniref:hypothetical protein n=1 Tax=Bacteriovorax sp. Seq25_V TaxID=1201288 RepID=UPI00038A3FB3|nr:hypothetical protein [Bacteriovorax sp. Seq25_V]EQC43776.1 putative lipoprotein [Bacteriovorax sp. Seq25_V]
MLKFISLFLILSLLSCSTNFNSRYIASIDSQSISSVTVVDDFQGEFGGEDNFKQLQNLVDDYNVKYGSGDFNGYNLQHVRVELVDITEKRLISDSQVLAIDAEVDEDSFHRIKIYYDSKVKKNLSNLSLESVQNFLELINNSKEMPNVLSFFEISLNAKLGDLGSKKIIKQLYLDSLSQIAEEIDGEVIQAYISRVEAEIEELTKDIKSEAKSRKTLEAQRKASIAALDKANEDGQLRTLIQKGDRHGAADLIEKYIPREQMTPMENRFWDHLLYKMRNPAPIENRVIMYRGTDGDPLYPAIKAGTALSKEEAIEKSELVAMSTMMTKNQGSWNRRLRSLQAIYGKDFSKNPDGESSKVGGARITTWMKNHSIDPVGSPFLSFTSSFETAHAAGETSMGAFLVDPEVLLFNQMSKFGSEMEYLKTLITFPDEMVAYYDESVHGVMDINSISSMFEEKIKAKLEIQFGENSSNVYDKIVSRSKDFADFYKSNLVPEVSPVVVEYKVKEGFFKRFFRKLLKKPAPVEEVIEGTQEKIDTKNNCLYIIKSFSK